MISEKSYRQLVKNLKDEPVGLLPVRISLLGDTATQFLAKVLRAYGREDKLDIDLYEADYDQIDMQIFDQQSAYHNQTEDYTIIYKSSLKALKLYYKTKADDKIKFADTFLGNIDAYVSNINEHKNTRIILLNLPEIPDQVFNNFANNVKSSWIYQLRKINLGLMDLAGQYDNVFIADLSMIQNRLGRTNFYDPINYTRSDAPISLKALPQVARSISNIIATGKGKFKKCLILDLDNTTWGGIIGDDGIEKIQVGSLGIGKAFTELQLWAKSLKERGVILCICSKNTESVAKEPFEKHPDMVLRLDDIAVFVANWESKADNIRHIQAILNIGFDSMVFLDDNPFERNLIREELPEVTVPELPEDPVEYMSYISQFNLFETASYSNLDKDRTQQYQTEAKRVVFQKSQGSLQDYLANLNMTAECKAFDEFHVPRIAQLTQRSNQFNLRTIRYSEQEVKNLIKSDTHITRYISLGDKFGDYGLISLLILEKKGAGEAFVDTWIMSCRVLKRDVEKFVLNEIVELCKAEGINTIIGERIPTKKNILVVDHYKNLGFEKIGEERWRLELSDYHPKEHFIYKTA